MPASTTFINAVKPQYVLFSTGYKNRYDHPSEEVLMSYRRFGAKTLNTATVGAISVRLGTEKAITPELFRQQIKRYWHTP